MDLIVHLPDTPKEQRELAQRAAALHAEAVIRCLEQLDCTDQEKTELLDMVIEKVKRQEGNLPPEAAPAANPVVPQ